MEELITEARGSFVQRSEFTRSCQEKQILSWLDVTVVDTECDLSAPVEVAGMGGGDREQRWAACLSGMEKIPLTSHSVPV